MLQGLPQTASMKLQSGVAIPSAYHRVALSAQLIRGSALRPTQVSQPIIPLSLSARPMDAQIRIRSTQLKLRLVMGVSWSNTCPQRTRSTEQQNLHQSPARAASLQRRGRLVQRGRPWECQQASRRVVV